MVPKVRFVDYADLGAVERDFVAEILARRCSIRGVAGILSSICPAYSALRIQSFGERFSRFSLPARQSVSVNIEGRTDVFVPQSFGHHNNILARLERHGSVKMPQAPKRDLCASCLLGEARQGMAQCVGMAPSLHSIARENHSRQRLAQAESNLILFLPVSFKHIDRPTIQVDDSFPA